MPRPATPTNVLELRGAYQNHPERKKQRKHEPEITPLSAPPKNLSVDERKIWREIIKRVPEGVIGDSDGIALETLTKLVYIMRHDFDGMTAAQLNKLETMLGRFGMTPSDRTKIVVKKEEKQDDPWADL